MIFEANWGKHGKESGPIRNKEMANYADALICFWDGKSKGTLNMINAARNKGIRCKIFQYRIKKGT